MAIGLPLNVKSIQDVVGENPALSGYAKFYNTKRFIEAGFVIFSQPQTHSDVTIYGLWLIDKQNVRKNKMDGGNEPEIVQDFIAYDRKMSSIKYFSGGRIIDPNHQGKIHDFCDEYGRNSDGTYEYYGCSANGKTTNHRYLNENDRNLPGERWIHDELERKLREVRKMSE